MNAKIAILLGLISICTSCNKGKYSTKPQLSLKDLNSTKLSFSGDQLAFTFNFTDKEGDIDSLLISRVSKVCSDTADTRYRLAKTSFFYRIPPFTYTKFQSGELKVLFGYNTIDSNILSLSTCIDSVTSAAKNDTSYFRFCLKDKQGNLSDTFQSPAIVFLRN
jgi:hypothetical protein